MAARKKSRRKRKGSGATSHKRRAKKRGGKKRGRRRGKSKKGDPMPLDLLEKNARKLTRIIAKRGGTVYKPVSA